MTYAVATVTATMVGNLFEVDPPGRIVDVLAATRLHDARWTLTVLVEVEL